jgi:hypothetical protein
MDKLKSADIKTLIVEHVRRNPPQLLRAIVPVSETGREVLDKSWTRTSKKKDGDQYMRVFDCWVGWNWLKAYVETDATDTTVTNISITAGD